MLLGAAAVDDTTVGDGAVIGIIVFAAIAVVGFVALAAWLWWPRRRRPAADDTGG